VRPQLLDTLVLVKPATVIGWHRKGSHLLAMALTCKFRYSVFRIVLFFPTVVPNPFHNSYLFVSQLSFATQIRTNIDHDRPIVCVPTDF